jgi:hypothetical protein
MANIKKFYQASSNLTLTGLGNVATSSTLVAGWLSAIIDNTTILDLDKIITGSIALGGSAVANGQICVYAIAQLDDTTWPAAALTSGTFGTQGTGAFKDTTNRDSVAVLVWSAGTRADPGTDDVYQIAASSLAGAFGGILPSRCVLFVTHSTGVNLAASGHQITVKGTYDTVS